MGALVNIFKKLFGGILGFISGLFGGKKNSIDGATVEPKLAAVKTENPAKAAPKAKKGKKDKDGFYAVADESTMDELPAANAIVSTTDAMTTDAKGKKVKAVPAKPVAKVAAPMSSEDLIVAALKQNQTSAGGSSEAQAPTAGFATQYLVPTLTSGRRSPGPSLKGFKAMAKEIRG